MILIADSGSTKTDWRWISAEGEIDQYQTTGINPYQQKEEEIRQEILTSLKPKMEMEVTELFFYGAGCSSEYNRQVLLKVFKEVFPGATVKINHDLMGAARSLCGSEAGIACILGTGTNSCFYDGLDIIDNVPSLGYVMGDEGSGAWLGKELLAHFLRGELPAELSERLEKRFELNKDNILENVYQRAMPNRYLAGFSRFIFQNLKNPVLYRLVHRGFELFFEKNVEKYERYQQLPVHFTGSVAFYYNSILRQVASDRGVVVKNIVESPIAGLTLYHQKNIG